MAPQFDRAWTLGAFNIGLVSPLTDLRERLDFFYPDTTIAPATRFVDFPVAVGLPRGLRRLIRPQAVFRFGQRAPFHPFPRAQALPLLEWGLNWCIATATPGYVLIHAAVVARNDDALILPGLPGSGKSTLAAGLMCAGWRLLSDEFAVIEPETGLVRPCLKALSLKERAIEILTARAPDAFTGETHDTEKGRVALMRPSADSRRAVDRPASVRWIVSPRFTAGADLELAPCSKGRGFHMLADNAFTYHTLGEAAFAALCGVVRNARCYRLRHGDLDGVVSELDRLTAPREAA